MTWEQTDAVPPSRQGLQPSNRYAIVLEPGEIRRRETNTTGAASSLTKDFKEQGRVDYHAVQRKVDGVLYVYIWRDLLPEGAKP